MKFYITRQHDRYGAEKPSENAIPEHTQYNDFLKKNVSTWTIELNSLEDIMALAKSNLNGLVIEDYGDDTPWIKLLDDFIE